MKIKVKDKTFNIVENYDEIENFYSYKAMDGNEEMGFINFKDSKIYGKRSFWIYKIEVNEKYQHQGVGQALLNAMEVTALDKRVQFILGKFYPTNQYAKPFYLKNGYTISREDDWEIEKVLDFDKVKNQSKEYLVDDKFKNEDRTM